MLPDTLESRIPLSQPGIDAAQILKAAVALGIIGANADFSPRLLTLLCNPRASALEIASLIATEPAMYARILRVANSPYYGHARSITTLERALLLLGRDAVRAIAAATCFDRTMARSIKGVAIDMPALLRHSLATAVAAEALAAIARRPIATEAFIAGLLHNLGITVQIYLDPSGIDAMIEANRGGCTSGIRKLECDHARVGHEECLGLVFQAWNMPDSLVACARHHHEPMDAPDAHRDIAALVNLGAGLGLASGATHTLEPLALERHVPAMRWLGLVDDDLNRVSVRLPALVAELGTTLFDRAG